MIIETWWSTITPGKEVVAEDLFKQVAQIVNRQYPGMNTRVLRPTTGMMNKIAFMSEFESIAARDEIYANLNDEILALREKIHDEKSHVVEFDAEHYYYNVSE